MTAPDPALAFFWFSQSASQPAFCSTGWRGRHARQFSGSTPGIVPSVLVGITRALIGYHVAALLALGGGLVTAAIAAALGAAAVLFAWRMAK
jgi:uncharacterized membrane protein YeaQ/YmgE (transglycosylase-associated protein family)